MKNLAARRLNWAARQWRRSERGNWFVNARGFNIVVFRSRKGWGIKVEQRYGSRCQFGQSATHRAEAKAPPLTRSTGPSRIGTATDAIRPVATPQGART